MSKQKLICILLFTTLLIETKSVYCNNNITLKKTDYGKSCFCNNHRRYKFYIEELQKGKTQMLKTDNPKVINNSFLILGGKTDFALTTEIK